MMPVARVSNRRIDPKWRLLILISVGSFMAVLDAPVVSIALPSIGSSFGGTSLATLAWVLDAYFVAFAAMLVFAGKFADQVGRRRLFVAGMVLFTSASIVCAAAPTVGVLIAARACQAIGGAAVIPAGQGLLLISLPPAERNKAIGFLAAVVAVGTAVAPAIGGLAVKLAGWEWIFWGSAAIGIIAIMYARSTLSRDQVQSSRALPDLLGSGLQAIGLGAVVFGILQVPAWGIGDIRVLCSIVGGLVAIAAAIYRSRSHRNPAIEAGLFRVPGFSSANFASFMTGMGLYAMALTSVLFFTDDWKWSALLVGASFIPGSVASAIMGVRAGKLARRFGAVNVGLVGSLAGGLGLALLAFTTSANQNYVSGFLPGQIVYGFGVAAGLTSFVAVAIACTPPTQFSAAIGINNALRQVGGAIGVAIVAAVFDSTAGSRIHDARVGWYLAAASFFLAAAVIASVRARKRASTLEPERAPTNDSDVANAVPAEGEA